MIRPYAYSRSLKAGCYTCHGDETKWFGPNSQGVAARHYDATGHRTWVEVYMHITYGQEPNQGDGS